MVTTNNTDQGSVAYPPLIQTSPALSSMPLKSMKMEGDKKEHVSSPGYTALSNSDSPTHTNDTSTRPQASIESVPTTPQSATGARMPMGHFHVLQLANDEDDDSASGSEDDESDDETDDDEDDSSHHHHGNGPPCFGHVHPRHPPPSGAFLQFIREQHNHHKHILSQQRPMQMPQQQQHHHHHPPQFSTHPQQRPAIIGPLGPNHLHQFRPPMFNRHPVNQRPPFLHPAQQQMNLSPNISQAIHVEVQKQLALANGRPEHQARPPPPHGAPGAFVVIIGDKSKEESQSSPATHSATSPANSAAPPSYWDIFSLGRTTELVGKGPISLPYHGEPWDAEDLDIARGERRNNRQDVICKWVLFALMLIIIISVSAGSATNWGATL